MITDRVQRLKEKSVNTKPRICMERAVAVTKAYQEHEGSVSMNVMRALAFKQIMEDKTIYIGDDEIIVG
ncbi:MAG: pyruvate formate lyase family protein, partial [Gallicola sp.]|nr:pyruvate formate lyase family protein [Gallicola sp.]